MVFHLPGLVFGFRSSARRAEAVRWRLRPSGFGFPAEPGQVHRFIGG